jgi:peptidoglycan/xylan/chitin deacetylase (PgdA/CDA1 family)
VINGEIVACPQLPTTLPTLDELIGVEEITAETLASHLLQRTAAASTDQVFTLHAELEGMKLLPVLDQLLTGWKAQGYELLALRDICATLDLTQLPRHEVRFAEIPGRSGNLMVQGPEFLV